VSDNSKWLRMTASELRSIERKVGGYDIEAAVANRSNAYHCLAAAEEIEALETEIKALSSKLPRWRNCADELPSDDALCIVTGYLLDDHEQQVPSTELAVYFLNSGWQIDSKWMAEVTHWMPLPEAPKP